MASKVDIIKSSKFILRDYTGIFNELIYLIENDEELFNINILNKLKKYKSIFIEYLQNNFINVITDDELYVINSYASDCLPEDLKTNYPSIFNENIYHDLIKNLKEISNKLLNKTFINNEVRDYIIDYVNNYNSFDTWKILFFKCVFILYDNTNNILNDSSIYYSTIEHFNNCTNIHQSPIEEWTFNEYDVNYNEYLELLYSYYGSEYEQNINTNINLSNDADDDDDDDDDEIEESIFIINFKNVFNDLNVYLYNNGCLSTKLFNYMSNSIEQANLSDLEINIYMRERYNALCYLYIKKLIEEYDDFYDYYVLYMNYHNTIESINNLHNFYTPEMIYQFYISNGGTDNEFIEIFKMLNDIFDDDNDDDNVDDDFNVENPLINKYTLIENNLIYDCEICFNTNEDDYFKCDICIFKICSSCYNNYHLKYNIDKCSHCRN